MALLIYYRGLDYTANLVQEWNETFFYKDLGIQKELTAYVEEAKNIIIDFATTTTAPDKCPDLAMELELLKEQFTKTTNVLSYKTQNVVRDIHKAVKDSHRLAVPAISNFLEPMYATCAARRGKFGQITSPLYLQLTLR